eukprot:10515-Heterococcus_DN1.PRE.1
MKHFRVYSTVGKDRDLCEVLVVLDLWTMAAHSFFDDIQALSTRCTARIAPSVCRRKACPPDALLGLKT